MRILRIADIPNNRQGGMSRTMYGTGDALQATGHRVDYLFAEDFGMSCPVRLRRFAVPLKIPGLVRNLRRKGRHYDLVEIHEPLAAPYCWLRWRSRKWPPAVVFSYGLEERSHRAALAYRRLKGLPISLKNRWSPLTVVLQAKYAVGHCDQVICSNSEDVRYLQRAGMSSEKVTQHHSGVNPIFLEAGSLAVTRERTGILFVGSWLLRKGILDLVPAVSSIMGRQAHLQFTIAGCRADPAQVYSQFSTELRRRIQVVPEILDDHQLIDLYGRHAILVLPSFFEGQPLVMIEAAAMGLAIVTTNICGMLDFITSGKNGLLVPPGQPAILARELEPLVCDASYARNLGESARLLAQQFTWANAGARLEQAYMKTIARFGQRSG